MADSFFNPSEPPVDPYGRLGGLGVPDPADDSQAADELARLREDRLRAHTPSQDVAMAGDPAAPVPPRARLRALDRPGASPPARTGPSRPPDFPDAA